MEKDEMSGYIKIDRKITEWEWYRNLNTKVVFFHCLLKANWKDGKFEGKIIKRGSFVTSIKKLSLELFLTEDEVRTAIKHLISTGELTKQTTNRYSVITVSNYELYQDIPEQIPSKPQTDTNQTPNSSHSIPKLFPTIEEYNKGIKEESEKENNNISCATEIHDDDGLEEFFNAIWKLYPIKKGKGQVSKTKKKVLQRKGYDQIKRCVERFINDMEGEGRDKRYWMHGSTFFNSGYVDYLDENYFPQKATKSNNQAILEATEEEEILDGTEWTDWSKVTNDQNKAI